MSADLPCNRKTVGNILGILTKGVNDGPATCQDKDSSVMTDTIACFSAGTIFFVVVSIYAP